MINSRNPADLDPRVAAMAHRHVGACQAAGIDLLITSTYRDHDSQNALFAQGRTTPGRKVTNARGGQSWHNYRLAYDVVPLRNGKPVWGITGDDGKLWARVGALGKECGLQWAGDWVKFKETAHFQWTGSLTMADLQAGRRP